MATYRYKARDQMGKLVEGTMEAPSQVELADKLRKMGYVITGIVPVTSRIGLEELSSRFRRIKPEDMIFFNIQLSNMLEAGLALLTCLRTISGQTENRRLKKVIEDVSLKVEAGASLSDAMQVYSQYFPKLTISMVRVGEASGNLALVLKRLADFGERELDLRQKIRGALFYPIILLCAGIAVTLFIVTFIIPQFVEIFIRMGMTLPMSTLILYKIGMGIKNFWHLWILAFIAGWLGIRYYVNTEKGRLNLDKLKLRLPILGPLYRRTAISRFARTLGTLVASGVSILESLDITKQVAGNEVIARVIENARTSVARGEKIAAPLKVSDEFPSDTVQMISSGEETGNLDGMLNKISDFYEKSLGYAIKKLTTILEPIFLVIMGSLVGFIMASMLLPIFDMMKMLRR